VGEKKPSYTAGGSPHCRGENIVILNCQRLLLWEGDQEVVKRSGRDKPMWVAMYMCIETILEISLYSYLYLKLAKQYVFFLLSLMFSLQQNQRTRWQIRFLLRSGGWGREVAQTIYTHVSKCKNNKIFKNFKRLQ
jgi:hypothetical protein